MHQSLDFIDLNHKQWQTT